MRNKWVFIFIWFIFWTQFGFFFFAYVVCFFICSFFILICALKDVSDHFERFVLEAYLFLLRDYDPTEFIGQVCLGKLQSPWFRCLVFHPILYLFYLFLFQFSVHTNFKVKLVSTFVEPVKCSGHNLELLIRIIRIINRNISVKILFSLIFKVFDSLQRSFLSLRLVKRRVQVTKKIFLIRFGVRATCLLAF